MAESRLARLCTTQGQSVWIDLLSRELVHSGELQRMIDEDSVTGLTSNPSIFQKAISRRRRLRRADPGAASRRPTTRGRSSSRLAVADVRAACDVFRPVWERDGGARRLRLARGRPGARLRRPRRRSSRRSSCTGGSTGRTSTSRSRRRSEGLPAIEDCIAARHPDQRHADLLARALPRRRRRLPARARAPRRRRRRPRRRSARSPRSSSRALDTEADARLERSSATPPLAGASSAIANAKLAYRHFEEAFAGAAWERLAAAGATHAAAALGLDLDQEPGLPRRRSTSRS